MNTMRKTIIAASLAFAAMGAAAQEQKIGVIDAQAVFQALPQAAAINATLAAEFKDRLDEVNRLEKDLQYYLEKQKRDTATMSQDEIKQLEEQLLSLRDEYAQKAQPLQQEMQRRQNEERNKVLGLIQQSVNKIAADESYSVVLNAGAVVYIDNAYNISEKVVQEVSNIK